MQNLQDYQSWKYVAAERLQYKYQDMLNLHWKFFLSFVNLGFGLLLHFCGILVKIVMPEVPKNISGQLALVTGGANGLGREIARCLAKEKCNIVICDLDIENAEKTAKEIESEFGVTTKAYKVDVSDFEAVDNLKKSIEEDVGFVDILVNNAGVMAITSLREGKPSDYKKIFDINVMSSFWVNKLFCLSFSGQLI